MNQKHRLFFLPAKQTTEQIKQQKGGTYIVLYNTKIMGQTATRPM